MRRARAALVTCLVLVGLVGPVTGAAAQTAPAPPPAGPRSTLGGERMASTDVVLPEGAPPLPALTASGWVVADLDTGQVLAARDPHGTYAPASTLKTLTALTLIPKIAPGTMVTPTYDDVAIDGSKVGLVQELAYPAKELFEALLIVSGNDAAMTLATAYGGVAPTVAAMNATAAQLQANDTVAKNPSGLDDPAQVTSAYDLALINRAAMQLPDFRAYVATKRSSISAPGGTRFEIYTHDKLLTQYAGALGIKNGYTVAARASFVGAATRDGHTLIVTLLRANPAVQTEAMRLLDWGFAATAAGVQPVGQLVGPVEPPKPTQEAAAVPVTGPAPTAAKESSGGGVNWLLVLGVVVVLGGVTVAVRRHLVSPAPVRVPTSRLPGGFGAVRLAGEQRPHGAGARDPQTGAPVRTPPTGAPAAGTPPTGTPAAGTDLGAGDRPARRLPARRPAARATVDLDPPVPVEPAQTRGAGRPAEPAASEPTRRRRSSLPPETVSPPPGHDSGGHVRTLPPRRPS
jgi:D-alanyl-D-alanine carboxypeptidase (penicillin-binding protein 5/6)